MRARDLIDGIIIEAKTDKTIQGSHGHICLSKQAYAITLQAKCTQVRQLWKDIDWHGLNVVPVQVKEFKLRQVLEGLRVQVADFVVIKTELF